MFSNNKLTQVISYIFDKILKYAQTHVLNHHNESRTTKTHKTSEFRCFCHGCSRFSSISNIQPFPHDSRTGLHDSRTVWHDSRTVWHDSRTIPARSGTIPARSCASSCLFGEWARMSEKEREWTRMSENEREWTRMSENGEQIEIVKDFVENPETLKIFVKLWRFCGNPETLKIFVKQTERVKDLCKTYRI